MIKILRLDAGEDGCALYRSVLPVKHCKDYLSEKNIDLELSSKIDWSKMWHYDILICNRFLNIHFATELYKWKQNRGLLIWDFDDNIFDIPESNPCSRQLQPIVLSAHELFFSWSDMLTTSTEPLKGALRFPEKTAVFPNLVDLDLWNPLPDKPNLRNPKQQQTIVYHGSTTHVEDIALVTEALVTLLARHEDLVVYFVGDAPNALYGHPRVWRFPYIDTALFPRFLRLLNADIFLCPLVDSCFNACKSAIKVLESTIAGGVVIASPVGPYNDFPINYARTSEEWVYQIERLLGSEAEAEGSWQDCMEFVRQNHSWQGPAGQLYKERFADTILRLWDHRTNE